MEKILILGSEGMLGHMLHNYLIKNSNYNIFTLARNESKQKNHYKCDITNTNHLINIIDEIRPNYIINCIGILVSNSSKDPSNAIFINSYIPHFLNKLSFTFKFKLIHISTDCVFSGKKGNYNENTFKDETNYYGLSKNLGEINNDNNVTIRTSIIGPEIKSKSSGLLDWILTSPKEIIGYQNAFWSGVTTLELSTIILKILNSNISGIVHITNGKKISKLELIHIVNKVFNLNKIITSNSDYRIDKSLIKTKKIQIEIPNYECMIKNLYNWMIENNSLYKKYKLIKNEE